MNSNDTSSCDPVYTDLQPCSLQCAQDNFVPNDYHDHSVDALERQLLLNFVSANENDNHDIRKSQQAFISENSPNTTDIILQQIETVCNGLTRDSFLSRLMELCDNDTDTLEHLRHQYFFLAKQRSDFPFPCAVLKKRIKPTSKSGEPLISKLCKDCFRLRLASKGEFLDDLKETLNLKSLRNDSIMEPDMITSTPMPLKDNAMKDNVIEIKSAILELRVSHEKDISTLHNKIDDLHKSNVKLERQLNKYREHLNNVQTQLNLARNLSSTLTEKVSQLESTLSEVSASQTVLSNSNKNIQSEMSDMNVTVQTNTSSLEKVDGKLDNTYLLTKELKSRIASESNRITKISDDRALGICNLKNRMHFHNERIKEFDSIIGDLPAKIDSCVTSITELRRRVNHVDKSDRQIPNEKTTSKSYATIASENHHEPTKTSNPQKQKPDEGIPVNPSPKLCINESGSRHSIPIIITSPVQNKEVDDSQKSKNQDNRRGEQIPTHFPTSVCNPPSSTFKGVVRKSKRISRFYVGGIDKSCSEEAMRNFLSERKIRVTYIKYFFRPTRRTSAAQLNIQMDDEHIVNQPNFWPKGIFSKPWLPWEQFVNERGTKNSYGGQ